jgi:hypothetical protein
MPRAPKPIAPKPVAPVAAPNGSNVREGVALTDAQAKLFDFLREPKTHPFRTRPDVAKFLFGGSWEEHRMRTGEAGSRIFTLAKKMGMTVSLGRGLDGKTQSYQLLTAAEAETERKVEEKRQEKILSDAKARAAKEAAKAARKLPATSKRSARK